MTEVRPEDVSRKIRDLYERGVAAYERENLDYAIEVLNTCLEFEPRLLAARKYLRAAEIRKHRHNAKNRVFHLVQTLAGLPQFLLGNLKLSRQPREALKTAESLMRRDPFNLLFIRLLGRAAEAADLPEAALQTLEVAREYYPHDGQLLDWMGRLYMQTGQARKARECYERLVQLRPTDPAALKKLKDATALDTMQKGGWDQATSYRDVIRDEKEAVRLEKESKAVKTERDIQDLIAALREDLKRTPDDVNRHRRLAELLVQAERYEEALEVLGRCQQLAGGRDPEIDQMFTNVKLKIFDRDIRRLREADRSDSAVPAGPAASAAAAQIALLSGSVLQGQETVRYRYGATGESSGGDSQHGRAEKGYSVRNGNDCRGHGGSGKGRAVFQGDLCSGYLLQGRGREGRKNLRAVGPAFRYEIRLSSYGYVWRPAVRAPEYRCPMRSGTGPLPMSTPS